MKKFVFATAFVALSAGIISCGGAHGDDPGRSYMPDMYYARAYEAYGYNMVSGEYDSLQKRGIRYNGMNVPGTIARGEVSSYHLTNDSAGMLAAQSLRNPLDSGAKTKPFDIKEAERLYLVYCGICHGTKLDGNGPLYNNGNGPYPAAPRPLHEAYAKALTDGHIFHVITFGKGSMGSYAAQLRPDQRWAVIKYIRTRQGGAETAANMTGTGTATKDSTGTKTSANVQSPPDTRVNPAVMEKKN